MRIAWFAKRIPHLTVVRTARAFREYFDTKPLVDFIFFDHDLGEGGTGYEAAEFIKERFGGNTTNAGIIHTWNPSGAARMRTLLPLTLWIPFGEFEVEMEATPDTQLHASAGSDSAHSPVPEPLSNQRSTESGGLLNRAAVPRQEWPESASPHTGHSLSQD